MNVRKFSESTPLIRSGIVSLALFCAAQSITLAQNVPVFRNTHAPLASRVNDLFGRLTENEKLTLLSGTGYTTQPIPRLKLGAIVFADAGLGVRGGSSDTSGPATAFPDGQIMASSWDRSLFNSVGQAIGEEAKNKGTGVQVELGPGVNINRAPLGGRDSEYYSEDPYLAAHLDVPFIEGLQSTGVGACVKHYACNNEEVDRMTVNVSVGQRAMREIYLPAFEAAVTVAHVDTIMPAYNKVNGSFSSANNYLLKNVLREDWGFDGMAISDWGAVHSCSASVNGGDDIEMPGQGFVTVKNLKIELANGGIKQSAIDGAVKNILRTMIRVGLADPVQHKPNHAIVGSYAHQTIAYRAALEGMVLLKNENGLLPLDPYKKQTIAIIGPRAKDWQIDTGGSAAVEPTVLVTPYQGIVHRVGSLPNVKIIYAAADDYLNRPVLADFLRTPDGKSHGLLGSYYANMTMTGKPFAKRVDSELQYNWGTTGLPSGLGPNNYSARWNGSVLPPVSGLYQFTISADDGCKLWVGGKKIIDHWMDGGATPISANIHLARGKYYPVKIEYYQHGGGASISFNWLPPVGPHPFPQAVSLAKSADIAIVVVGSEPESENSDRKTLHLDSHQDDLVSAVAAANPNTIVILNNGGPVVMRSWIHHVPAVLEAGFGGEYGGKAVASILFGDTNPSGKLTDTYAVKRQDYPDYANYPGKHGVVHYAEGVYVGYRWFDRKNIAPQFPFGYGLSYTTFTYSGLVLPSAQWDTTGTITVTAQITNSGKVAGSEVAELYIEPKSPLINRPIRELKGFDRVTLAPGETKTATFVLSPRDFAYCDVPGKQWKADAGDYNIEVGGSSRDLPLSSQLTTTQTWTQPIHGML